MVLSRFQNPVAVHQGGDAFETLERLLDGRRFLLVTTAGWMRRGVAARVAAACGAPVATIDSVAENPKLQYLETLESTLQPWRGSDLAVVSIGGGSVLDSAKAVAAGLAPGATMRGVGELARSGSPLPEGTVVPALLCVPTTAGTGSEVTKTATLWDADGTKYSLSDDRLYPQAAILDPALLPTLPDAVVLSSGLDILSHALESIWNVHHNAISDSCARDAIRRVWRSLPIALVRKDAGVLADLQTAAMLAGMAISATRTALAHSMSYPLTGRFGLRHGLACSFTLPEVAAFMLDGHGERGAVIAEALGLETPARIPETLHGWMAALGAYRAVADVIDAVKVRGLGPALITTGRANNGIRQATAEQAEAMLQAALTRPPAATLPQVPSTGRVIWITGLSCAVKTTLSRAVADQLRAQGRTVMIFDGDELRLLIGGSLGYKEADRRELTYRYAALSRALAQQGVDVICATIGLFHANQQWNREHIPHYTEVFLKVDLQTLMARDSKGLYARARRGETTDVVGIDITPEYPQNPDLVIDNAQHRHDFRELAARVVAAARQPAPKVSR